MSGLGEAGATFRNHTAEMERFINESQKYNMAKYRSLFDFNKQIAADMRDLREHAQLTEKKIENRTYCCRS